MGYFAKLIFKRYSCLPQHKILSQIKLKLTSNSLQFSYTFTKYRTASVTNACNVAEITGSLLATPHNSKRLLNTNEQWHCRLFHWNTWATAEVFDTESQHTKWKFHTNAIILPLNFVHVQNTKAKQLKSRSKTESF